MYIYVLRYYENKQTEDLFCYKSSEKNVFVKKCFINIYIYIYITYFKMLSSKWTVHMFHKNFIEFYSSAV